MEHCQTEKFNENTSQKNHLGDLVMCHWVAAKQYTVVLQSFFLCAHITSLETLNVHQRAEGKLKHNAHDI